MHVHLKIPSRQGIIKGALALGGTILLGAIGSGVWSWLLAPGFQALGRFVLNLASLGFHSYKDGIYKRIAADNSAMASVETLFLLSFLYAMATTGMMMYLFIVIDRIRSEHE